MAPDEDTVLMLAGDVMTGRGIDQVLAHSVPPVLFESYVQDARDYVRLAERTNGPIPAPVPPAYPWGDALAEIERAAPDVRIVNLETAVTTAAEAWPGKGVHYRMHPANVDCLLAARIDCCALANNHVIDWGRRGLDETLSTLHDAGLRSAGAGPDGEAAWMPAVLPVAGGARVLVLACATASSGVPEAWAAGRRRSGVALLPELSEASARELAARVAAQRRDGDLVVVSIHWGGNWSPQVPSAHRRFARRLIELGVADVVHGHSSHHPMPIEIYRGKPILYGCGDLINDYEGIGGAHGDLRSDLGCLVFAALSRDGAQLRRLEVVPLQLRRFRLGPVDAGAREWLARVFAAEVARLEPLAPPRQGWSLGASVRS